MYIILLNVNFFVLGYSRRVSVRFNVAKDNDSKITGQNEETKTKVTVSATTKGTEETDVNAARSEDKSQNVNQELKNVKLEDLIVGPIE